MSKRKPHEPRKRRNEPQIRVTPKGVVVDGFDSYSRAVVGAPPHDFKALLGFAQDLLPVAMEACGVDEKDLSRTADQIRSDTDRVRDTLLTCAWVLTETANGGDGENPTAFVQRAKQVVAWCQPRTDGLTLRDVLEAKNRELARLIGQRLSRHEGFILTIFDHGTEGDPVQMGMGKNTSSWISSVDRRQSIALLSTTLEGIKADQAAHS